MHILLLLFIYFLSPICILYKISKLLLNNKKMIDTGEEKNHTEKKHGKVCCCCCFVTTDTAFDFGLC